MQWVNMRPLTFFTKILAGCIFIGLTGCQTSVICNKTPAQLPQNNSELYTIAMEITPNGQNIVQDSCSAKIAIDGEIYDMNRANYNEFTFNYRRPLDHHRVCYYYDVSYVVRGENGQKSKNERSPLYQLTVANRYAIGFESNRGVPSNEVILLGRGFVKEDYIEIGGTACQTRFISPNALSFTVPMLEKFGKFDAVLVSDNGNIGLGEFCIDPLGFHVNVDKIQLHEGEKMAIIVQSDIVAPSKGITIEVTTDIPDSIIMKDIFIPEGAKQATVVVCGKKGATGSLFLEAKGFSEVQIPVEIITLPDTTADMEKDISVIDADMNTENFLNL